MEKNIVVQGYTIIKCERTGDVMVVVGHNPKAPQPYVTWKAYAHSNFSSFVHGNYFSTLKDTMVDFYRRLGEIWELYIPERDQLPSKPSRSLKEPKPPKRGGPDR